MNYSVDMLRLRVYDFTSRYRKFFQGILNTGAPVDYYKSYKPKDFYHNFSFHEQIDTNPFDNQPVVNNFWVGFQHNSQKLSDKDYLYIEFNPNKCDISKGLLRLILTTFYTSFNWVELCSCDIAVDLPGIRIDSVFFDKCLKQYTCDMRSKDGRTMYIGARGSNGRIKIYDKAAEQGLKDKILTRYEVSIKFDSLILSRILSEDFDFEFNVPDVYFFKDLDVSQLGDVNMRSYIFSVMCGFTQINDYSYRTKQKIKQTLVESASIKKIDKNIKNNVSNTIISYFNNYCNTFEVTFDKFFYAEKRLQPVNKVFAELDEEALKHIEKMQEEHKQFKADLEAREKEFNEVEKRWREDCKNLPSYDELMSLVNGEKG